MKLNEIAHFLSNQSLYSLLGYSPQSAYILTKKGVPVTYRKGFTGTYP